MEYNPKNLNCSMFHVPCSKNSGFTIIEIIIAISVLSFGIVLVQQSFLEVANATYAGSFRLTASYLAQEGLEIIRSMRDSNVINNTAWPDGFLDGPCAVACQADYSTKRPKELAPYNNSFLGLNQDGFYSYQDSLRPSIFKRKITIQKIPEAPGMVYVTVEVIWSYNGKPFNIVASEYLYDK